MLVKIFIARPTCRLMHSLSFQIKKPKMKLKMVVRSKGERLKARTQPRVWQSVSMLSYPLYFFLLVWGIGFRGREEPPPNLIYVASKSISVAMHHPNSMRCLYSTESKSCFIFLVEPRYPQGSLLTGSEILLRETFFHEEAVRLQNGDTFFAAGWVEMWDHTRHLIGSARSLRRWFSVDCLCS